MTTIVIEDLHLVDETVALNMPGQTIEKIFAEITKNVKQAKPNKLTLILNGDIFDTLTSELWLTNEFNEDTAIKVFKNIQKTETAKIFQKEIKKLCSMVPVEIQYINGNHDLVNEFRGLRNQISDFLEMTMWENIFFTNVGFFDETTGVYATHGDKNDAWKIWQSKLGNQMQIWFTVKALVNIRDKTNNPNFREINNVGEVLPRRRSKFIKSALGKKDGNEAKKIIRQTAEQFFVSEFTKDAIKALFSEKPAIAKITKKIVCNRISARILTRLLLAYYYSVEKDIRNRKQKKEIYKHLEPIGIQAKYIVTGHTHEQEHSKITGTNTEFINLGYCQKLGFGLDEYDKIRGNIFLCDNSSTKIIHIKIPDA